MASADRGILVSHQGDHAIVAINVVKLHTSIWLRAKTRKLACTTHPSAQSC